MGVIRCWQLARLGKQCDGILEQPHVITTLFAALYVLQETL
jgi:hypothetical protein